MSLDWQFLVVTAAALWGLWILLRPFLPRRRKEVEAAGGCPNCTAAGSCASAGPRDGREETPGGLVTLPSRRSASPNAVLKIKN